MKVKKDKKKKDKKRRKTDTSVMNNNAPVAAIVTGNGRVGTVTQHVNSAVFSFKEGERKEARRCFEETVSVPGDMALLEVAFLDQMKQAAAAVCAIAAASSGAVVGTGFLLGGGWIATNLHVIDKDYKEKAGTTKKGEEWKTLDKWGPIMGYLKDVARSFSQQHECWFDFDSREAKNVQKFKLASSETWILLPHLDVALIRVDDQEKLKERIPLTCATSDQLSTAKTRCFVIGHPVLSHQQHKMLSMQRDNTIFCRAEHDFLRYFTDTHWGNSGSPVLVWNNSSLVAVAIHHSGMQFERKDDRGNIGYNEGTMMVRLLKELEKMGRADVKNQLLN